MTPKWLPRTPRWPLDGRDLQDELNMAPKWSHDGKDLQHEVYLGILPEELERPFTPPHDPWVPCYNHGQLNRHPMHYGIVLNRFESLAYLNNCLHEQRSSASLCCQLLTHQRTHAMNNIGGYRKYNTDSMGHDVMLFIFTFVIEGMHI